VYFPEEGFSFPIGHFFQYRTSAWLLLIVWQYLSWPQGLFVLQATSLSWYRRQSGPEERAVDKEPKNSGFQWCLSAVKLYVSSNLICFPICKWGELTVLLLESNQLNSHFIFLKTVTEKGNSMEILALCVLPHFLHKEGKCSRKYFQ